MLIYSVTISVGRDIEFEWLDWMKRVHVPNVLRTGRFLKCHIYQRVDTETDEPTYVLQYHCHSLQDYRRYQQNSAPALQKEHTGKFAGKFRASRQILEEIETLKPEPA